MGRTQCIYAKERCPIIIMEGRLSEVPLYIAHPHLLLAFAWSCWESCSLKGERNAELKQF